MIATQAASRKFAALSLLLIAWGSSPVFPQSPRAEIRDWLAEIQRAELKLGEKWSVSVKDMASGRIILDHRANQKLIPASNRKIIVFALALDLLGPEFSFTTELGVTGTFDRAGETLNGSVVLRGDGDPTLSSQYLDRKNPASILRGWIARLAGRGLRRVNGDLIIDASAFGDEQDSYPVAWDLSHRNHAYAPLPSALALNGNLLRVTVRPAQRVGSRNRVRLYPDGEGIAVIDMTETTSRSHEGLDAIFGVDGKTLFTKGRVGRRISSHVLQIPLPYPLAYVRDIVRDALRAEGIAITGRTVVLTDSRRDRRYGTLTTIAVHRSMPLDELLTIMLRKSDNFLAEQIWRATAFYATGDGSTQSARRMEQRWLEAQGLAWIEPGHDASGLSRINRISSSELVALLEKLYGSPHRTRFLDSLPVSGRSGTLKGRAMGGAAGRIVAKTGTLSGVSALSGYIRDRQGRERWAFSLLANAPEETNGRLTARQNQIMKNMMQLLDLGSFSTGAARPPVPVKRYRAGTKQRADQGP
ncbi:D-alanyl-D-alanine carboxypeptidase/D-alanyl-D-alanine-endopeptidase [Candidatus Sumerlaeota bacterium]|nr:D-alanyl-D-alanine carboxypeptidase/D-alanyl-D-alanine-endopeptidase [Candidatus Sumerlaeota bacterium]